MLTHPTALRIEYWPIERLVEYPGNPRKNDAAVDRMCGSIREFGLAIPLLARSSGEVIDGHLRLKAARKMDGGLVATRPESQSFPATIGPTPRSRLSGSW
jgi:ParB-like nuclease domain